jgi:threonine aldolase
VKLLDGDRGRLDAQQVADAISPLNDVHSTITRLVSLENTMNKGGGCYYDLDEIRAIRGVCDAHDIPLHLDGARLFNALVATGETPAQHGELFDSISICLSKGLGCPVGSLLLGKADFITKARRFRKVMGGGWRQAGFLAAAGTYALDHQVDRLKEDHARAKSIGEMLRHKLEVEYTYPIDTNIIIFKLPESILAADYVRKLDMLRIKAVTFGKHLVRFVTHHDFTDDHLTELEKQLAKL